MRFGEVVQNLQPGQRVRISFPKAISREGKRMWSETLTDARMLAYWDHKVVKHRTVENTVGCILGSPNDPDPEPENEDEVQGV